MMNVEDTSKKLCAFFLIGGFLISVSFYESRAEENTSALNRLFDNLISSGRKYPIKPTAYILLGVTTEPSAIFFVPFAIATWRQCNIEPIIFISNPGSMNSSHMEYVTSVINSNLSHAVHFSDGSIELRIYKPTYMNVAGGIAWSRESLSYSPEDVVLVGNVQVLPLKCEYFKSIPRMINSTSGLSWIVEQPGNATFFTKSYIAASAGDWTSLLRTKQCRSFQCWVESVFQTLLRDAANVADLDIYDKVEKMLYDLPCYPLCIRNGTEVRDYNKLIQGPWGDLIWANALNQHLVTFHALSRMIEARVGSGPFSLYGKNNWKILFSLLHLYIDDKVLLAYLHNYQMHFYSIQDSSDIMEIRQAQWCPTCTPLSISCN